MVLFGIHGGDDIAPWNGAAHPTAMAMARWVSKSNNDSLWGGIDSLNGGKFKDGHDNLQQFNLTRTHRFNEAGTLLTSTEAYYLFQTHALVGETVDNGPLHSWFQNVAPAPPFRGMLPRSALSTTPNGSLQRRTFSRFARSITLSISKDNSPGSRRQRQVGRVGVTHRFNELVSVRPEARYEYAFSARPWDNGTRKGQFMFAMDALVRF
jgi:hypothetical protein